MAIARCGARNELMGRALAPAAATMTTPAMPTTHPIRNGSAEWFRFGESRMRMVAMMETELTATATAMGRSSPSADSMLLPYQFGLDDSKITKIMSVPPAIEARRASRQADDAR